MGIRNFHGPIITTCCNRCGVDSFCLFWGGTHDIFRPSFLRRRNGLSKTNINAGVGCAKQTLHSFADENISLLQYELPYRASISGLLSSFYCIPGISSTYFRISVVVFRLRTCVSTIANSHPSLSIHALIMITPLIYCCKISLPLSYELNQDFIRPLPSLQDK